MTVRENGDEVLDRALLNAIVDFTLTHPHSDVQRFRDAVNNWGSTWHPVEPVLLPATRFLERTLSLADAGTRPLIEGFITQRARLHWEQSYRRKDNVVSDDMLNGYGFAEILGQRGPFVSERVRSGLGVWGPSITYPIHWHEAEEIYVVMGGSADFTVGDAPSVRKRAGEVVYVPSGTPHGFQTTDEPLAVFYLWQAGALREISTFA